jgi:hypothetical protein
MSARARTDLVIGLVLAVLGAAGVAWQAGVSSADAGELMHRTFICPLGGHMPDSGAPAPARR